MRCWCWTFQSIWVLSGLYCLCLSACGLTWHPLLPVSRWAQSGSHSLLMGSINFRSFTLQFNYLTQVICAKTFDASHRNACSVAGLLSFLYLIIIFTELLKQSMSVFTVCLTGCSVFLFYALGDCKLPAGLFYKSWHFCHKIRF